MVVTAAGAFSPNAPACTSGAAAYELCTKATREWSLDNDNAISALPSPMLAGRVNSVRVCVALSASTVYAATWL